MRRLLKPGRLVWVGLALLAAAAVFKAPWGQIWETLNNLSLAELSLLLALNLLITLLFSSRWWLILRAQGQRLPYLSLAAYRLAGFSISYFTPGSQFGGEPLQIHLLRQRQQAPASSALASLTLDKLFEVLGNFTFLATGLVVLLSNSRLAQVDGMRTAAWIAVFWILPLVYLGSLWLGRKPFNAFLSSALLNRLPADRLGRAHPSRLSAWVSEAEGQASELLRRKPWIAPASLLVSALVWLLSIGEYWLMLNFLGAPVNLAEAVSALTMARLAFLTPVPAGLGVLEASQALALQALGYGAATGLSASLLIRGRDLTVGLAGLWIGGLLARRTGNDQNAITKPPAAQTGKTNL